MTQLEHVPGYVGASTRVGHNRYGVLIKAARLNARSAAQARALLRARLKLRTTALRDRRLYAIEGAEL